MIVSKFEHAGLQCIIRPGGFEGFCGYVAVPEGHPLHGVDYGAECAALAEAHKLALQGPVGKRGVMTLFRGDVACPETVFNVHGSLTFSGAFRREPELDPSLWWFGFDTAHANDGPSVQNVEYVTEECKSLADQIAALFPQPVAAP